MFTLCRFISHVKALLTNQDDLKICYRTWATLRPSMHFCIFCSVCHISSAPWAKETIVLITMLISYVSCVKRYFSNPSVVKNKEQICSQCVATKTLLHGRERAQYAPVSDKGNRATVCSQSWYEWKPSSPSCAHAGPPCTSLEWKRRLWHWTGPENNPLNGLHTRTVIVGEKERTLLEHGQTWKHAASVTTLWPSLTSPLCHGLGFQSPPSPCTGHGWLTGGQPHDWAYPLHVVLPAFTGAMFFFVGLHANSFTNGKRQVLWVCRRQDVVMVQCTETARPMRKHSRFSIVSQSPTLWQNSCFFLLHSNNCGNVAPSHKSGVNFNGVMRQFNL